MFHDQKDQVRLFQIGLKAARDFVEGLKSRDDAFMRDLNAYMPGVSTDFMVGRMYEIETTKASDEIEKYQDEQGRQRLLDPSQAKSQAEITYRKSNCSLIQ
jgi:hypothetical protein